ncbi:MAG: response regulator [Acetobacteraceae bacterium]
MTDTAPRAAAGQRIVVLVAEDNQYDRLILQEAFAELGLDIDLQFVSDGEEVLDYLRRRNGYAADDAAPTPTLVLMDLNMPRMNGHDAVREIRADPILRVLPVIVLSTSDSPRQIAQAYANGVNAFMTKPGRFEDFVDLLRGFHAFWFEHARLPSLASS